MPGDIPSHAPGDGSNPTPIRLVRPKVAPMSAMALLGKKIFFDKSLSASGKIACATCHNPDTAYGPPNRYPVQPGGPSGKAFGIRAVPSLRYLFRNPSFSIGPEDAEAENVDIAALATRSAGMARPQKTAGSAAATTAMVPQGGLFWDGRANTLQHQAMGPLLSPFEMANHDVNEVSRKLQQAPYVETFTQLFGPRIFADSTRVVDEAMFAVARFQVEDPSFRPFSSKYDAYLEGKATLSAAERHGLDLFNDRNAANCAGCHPSRASQDGRPPMFTDFQYEALGVPRNPAIRINRDPGFYDLGLCGPIRTDLVDQKQYCGMFRTPSLRNTAVRPVYFHNARYTSLEQVMEFYDFRDTQPEKIYPHGDKFNDLPATAKPNADVTDPPFDRSPRQAPAMSKQDMRDIIAFLKTLNDGYLPTTGGQQ
jgi:cytochrome c peroxidase